MAIDTGSVLDHTAIMKICFKCLDKKPLTEFYRHSEMADGHLNKCKDCARSDAIEHRENNLERVRRYDRRRGQTKERKAKNRAYYRRNKDDPVFKEKIRERRAIWLERNTVKRAAHIICGNYKRDGKIVLPDKCEQCDETEGLNAHHEDYTKPLDVIWLCNSCHGKRHQEINELIRNGEDWSEKGF